MGNNDLRLRLGKPQPPMASPEPATIACEPRPMPPCLLRGPPDPAQERADNRDPEDYNIRSEERKTLLTQLKAALKDSPVTPAFWACCQVCDKSALEALIQLARRSSNFAGSPNEDSSLIPLLCKLPAFRLCRFDCRNTHG